MALYLTEILTGAVDRAAAEELVERLGPAASGAGGRLLEVQVSEDLARIFFVAENVDPARLTARITDLGVARTEPALVRLVGATVDAVRARAGSSASHLVADVWVGGRQVVAGGRCTTVDDGRARREVQRRAERLASAVAAPG